MLLIAHLLREVEDHLLSLLRSLDEQDWDRPTIVPQWTVRNIAAHLLDTELRKLSIVRDGYMANPPAIASNDALVAFINRINAEGVAFYSRLSAPVLIELMETASRASCEFHELLDPAAKAAFSVSWAGEFESLNWFDTARELTERWHHQQQIRLATNKPGLFEPRLYFPVLDTFMRALPHAYRDVAAEAGTRLEFIVSGEAGGTWALKRATDRWQLTSPDMEVARPRATSPITASVTVPQEIAWRVFTKGISRNDAIAVSKIEGDRRLAEHFFSTLAIVG